LQASEAALRIARQVSKTRLERCVSRRYGQTFSMGLPLRVHFVPRSGERGGRKTNETLSGMDNLFVVCQPARSSRRAA
jgi:hypothetical protein